MGTTVDSFQSLGTLPFLTDKLNSSVTEGAIPIAVCFSILAEIPSGPLDLETSKQVRSSHIVSSSQRSSSGGSTWRLKSLSDQSFRGVLRRLKHMEKNLFLLRTSESFVTIFIS